MKTAILDLGLKETAPGVFGPFSMGDLTFDYCIGADGNPVPVEIIAAATLTRKGSILGLYDLSISDVAKGAEFAVYVTADTSNYQYGAFPSDIVYHAVGEFVMTT